MSKRDAFVFLCKWEQIKIIGHMWGNGIVVQYKFKRGNDYFSDATVGVKRNTTSPFGDGIKVLVEALLESDTQGIFA